MSGAARPALVLALLALAWGAAELRRAFIRGFFDDGPPGPPPALTQPPAPGPALRPVAQTRVLLIDGLDAATARGLPALNGLCAGGLDLVVDVGFPTVSLPVQAVLWTGLAQQQSGLLYRIVGLPAPPPGALPARVPGSVAVAEEQPFIAGSFGFAHVGPAGAAAGPAPPGATGHPSASASASASAFASAFAQAAREAVAGPAVLAFVHVLRVDKAGHKGGTAGAAYARAAAVSDALLGELLAAAPPSSDRRWLVLSDHGHRRGGGHGGGEPEVRLVRACLAGGPAGGPARPSGGPAGGDAPPPAGGGPVHLVDLSRALFESVGQGPPAGAVGRPLAFARVHPDAGATLPHPAPARLALAGFVLALALAAALVGRPWLPLAASVAWLPLAYGASALIWGLPTLSNPIVYPPQGRDLTLGALPGLVLLLLIVARAAARVAWPWSPLPPPSPSAPPPSPLSWWPWSWPPGPRPPSRGIPPVALRQPLLCAGLALACLLACGGVTSTLGVAGAAPPLAPVWTAHASQLLAVLAGAARAVAAGLALGWTLPAARAWLRRHRRFGARSAAPRGRP